MATKWYLSAFIVILTVLGVTQEQYPTPNQEIVLQFTHIEVPSVEAEKALATVKTQLQSIGVEHIKVRETSDGKLKITYYSDLDVVSIEDALSQDTILELDAAAYSHNQSHKEIPSENSSIDYNLDVYEIQKDSDIDLGFNGVVLEHKIQKEHIFYPKVDKCNANKLVRERNHIEQTAYVIHGNFRISKYGTSRYIPESRAGPAFKHLYQ